MQLLCDKLFKLLADFVAGKVREIVKDPETADLLIPKTSSRAITSAAGTADAMETVARVDLTPPEVERVVHEASGCIAWNGRLNHSPIDDVMNSITRPLGIDSFLRKLERKFGATRRV